MPVHFRNKLFSRSAFTLVELMVAMAIIILMLSIMSQAFVIATGAMQGLKEACDMHEKMRPVITLLQRDLGALHFDGSRKLSDSNFWDSGPPKEGYFMLWQDQAYEKSVPVTFPNVEDGNEGAYPIANGVSFRRSAAAANHMLAFSVKLPAKTPDDFFQTSNVGFGNIFHNLGGAPSQRTDANARRFETNSTIIKSNWAEVAYFLGPHTNNGLVTPDGATDGKSGPPQVLPLPYFNLYRQQRLVLPSHNIFGVTVPDFSDTNANRDLLNELSYHPENTAPPILKFNTPSDLTVPWKRMGNRISLNQLGSRPANLPLFSEFPNNSSKAFTDIIATNVISFDVRILTDDNRYDYEDLETILNQPNPLQYLSIIPLIPPYSVYPPVNSYGTARVFDTWTTDQGNPANPLLKYDLGDWNNNLGKYQPSPSGNNLGYYRLNSLGKWWEFNGNYQFFGTGGNNSLIPVWNVSSNTGLKIKSIQISIRIWDSKSNSAKMFVIVQKL